MCHAQEYDTNVVNYPEQIFYFFLDLNQQPCCEQSPYPQLSPAAFQTYNRGTGATLRMMTKQETFQYFIINSGIKKYKNS